MPDRIDPFAKAACTSSRMLIYHFGSRDKLLLEVLKEARRLQVKAFTDLLAVRENEPYLQTLSKAWLEISGAKGKPYLRMFSELHDVSGKPLWPGFRKIATTDWIPPLTEGLTTIGRTDLATLVLAVIRGLLIDLAATGDRKRVDQAFSNFIETLKNTT